MRPTRVVVEHESSLPQVFSRWLADRLSAAMLQRGHASLALPGGSVAEKFLPALSDQAYAWSGVHWFWGDERVVPPDDVSSNYALARRLLLEPLGIGERNIHPIPVETRPLEQAAKAYTKTLQNHLGGSPRLDVALLGVGSDGHVCSLFPGHSALNSHDWVTHLSDSPKPPAERLTLTLKTLANARTLALAAFGRAKAALVRELLVAQSPELPATQALGLARHSVMFLDHGAASLLTEAELRRLTND